MMKAWVKGPHTYLLGPSPAVGKAFSGDTRRPISDVSGAETLVSAICAKWRGSTLSSVNLCEFVGYHPLHRTVGRERRKSAGSRTHTGATGGSEEARHRSERSERGSPDRRKSGSVGVSRRRADVCGALGCRESSELLEIEREGERRVLCVDHARRWISR